MKLLRNIVMLLVIGILSTSAIAAETINIVRGFSLNSHPANVLKEMISIMNARQTKYEFVLLSKPGAGGIIATKFVADNPANSLLSISSAFIMATNNHQSGVAIPPLTEFDCLLVQATDIPLVLVSKKYNNIDSILQGSKINLVDQGTTSVSGFASQVFQKYNPNIEIAATKTQPEALMLVIGEHADAGFVYYDAAKPHIDAGNLNLLGITGNQHPSDRQTVLLKKYIPVLDKLTISQSVYAHSSMNINKRNEIHALLKQAQNSPQIKKMYTNDDGILPNFSRSQNNKYFVQEQKYWSSTSKQAN